MAARKRSRQKRKAPKRSGGVKGARLYSDVAAAVKTANGKSCKSPERRKRLQGIITYIRKAAELESHHGLNKTSARRRVAGLLQIDKAIIRSFKRCRQAG
jgi:hypothetical protein